MGDLNCNMLEPTLLSTRKLNEILELYQMQQLINNPTRVTELTQSLLDVYVLHPILNILFTQVFCILVLVTIALFMQYGK